MIAPSTIDDIRDVPIEQIVGKYTDLKKSGPQSLKACCPFTDHAEKTPSFHIKINKNTFHCYGCGRGGDVIEFVMIRENLPFLDACKFIAKDAGIRIEETQVKGKTEEEKKAELTMMQIVHLANQKYVSLLNSNL